ncbi:MAG: hypothetical protein VYE77_05270 [Planctomycetota bacterium]|nr:hypothetical protein [Planctomycetota bacterium]
MRRSIWLAAAWVLLCGAVSGWLVEGVGLGQPRPHELTIQNLPFHLETNPSEPFLVRPEKWLALPALRQDFDMHADVELAEETTLDFVLRRVEPRGHDGVSLPFQGRFRVLRVTTGSSGELWHTPAEALLNQGGGIPLAAGSRATVSIRARGRSLEASVAGRPWLEVEAEDDYGGLALIARGGAVAVYALDITPKPRPSRLPLWLVGLVAATPFAGLAVALRLHLLRLLLGGLGLVVVTELVRGLAFADLPPLADPDRSAELLVAWAAAPLGLALCCSGKSLILSLICALALAAGTSWWVAGAVEQRFGPRPEIEALLGPDAGEQAVAALARRVPGPLAVHTLQTRERLVFLLGGQLLYQRGAAPDEHIEPLLLGELRRDLADVDVVALPTVDGWSEQQWTLFELCYADYRPQVLVLGIPASEAAEVVEGQPRSSPEVVTAVVERARQWCKANNCELVLLADARLSQDLVTALRSAGADLALVEVTPNATPMEFARQLAAAVAGLLD